MDSLDRIAKHLPNTGLLTNRVGDIVIDANGKVWVPEDTTLVILKGHLIVESELIDICQRLLKNPSVLNTKNLRFSTRLNLVRALLDADEVPETIWGAIGDLNQIRNKLAHNLEPNDIEADLGRFFSRFNEFENFRSLREMDKGIQPKCLVTCLIFLTGLLSSIAKPTNPDTVEGGELE